MKVISRWNKAQICVLFVLLIGLAAPCHAESRRVRILHEMNALTIGADAYRKEYGQFPTGKNIEVSRALSGENPRRIIFVELAPRTPTMDQGFLDEWNTPYLITLPDSETVEVRSAGPDRVINTDDDRFYIKGVRGVTHNVNTRRGDLAGGAVTYFWTTLVPLASVLLCACLLFASIRNLLSASRGHE